MSPSQHPSYPLTAQHLAQINEQLRALHEASLVMEKAIASGLPVHEHKANIDQMHAVYSAIKQNFFPGVVADGK